MTNVFFSENIKIDIHRAIWKNPTHILGFFPTHITILSAHHASTTIMTLGANAMETLETLDRTKALLGLFKEISDATGTDAREDLHEFGGRDAEEGHACLTSRNPWGLGTWALEKNPNIFGEGNGLYWYQCICIFTIHESKLPYSIKLVFVCFS